MAASALSLRPLGTGELLDRAVRLYRRHFLTFIGIVAIVQIPLTLVQMGFSILTLQGTVDPTQATETVQTTMLLGSLGSLVVSVLGLVLVQSLGTAALTRAIGDSYLSQPVSLSGAYRKIGRTWLVLVVAIILVILLSIGFTIWWLVVPCIGWLTGLGMLYYLFLVISPLVAPAVILEKQRARAAVRRAWDLSRRRFWPVVGYATALLILNLVFVMAPVFLVSFLLDIGSLTAADSFTAQQTLSTIVGSLTGLVFNLIFLPFQLTAMTLLYFDLRIRTEGFDLAVLARSLTQPGAEGVQPLAAEEAVPPAVDLALATAPAELAIAPAELADMAAVLAEAPVAAGGNLVTGKELSYFLLLTLVFGVLYFLLIVAIGGLAFLGTM